jgi:hypothetical protein
MFDYYRAARQYAAGRKYSPIGTKLNRHLWLNYEPGKDCYTVSYVFSRYYTDIDAKGNLVYLRADSSMRGKYTMRTIAYIHKDHVRLVADPNSGSIVRDFFRDMYYCTYRDAPGIKIKGIEWTLFAPSTSYFDRCYANGELLYSIGDVLIFPDGTYKPAGAPLVRVHDKERRAILNKRIRDVRRMLVLRAKLGGFSSVDWEKVGDECKAKYGSLASNPRAFVRCRPKVINDMLMAVDPENFESMLPLLWLSVAYAFSPYTPWKWKNIDDSYNWLRHFNTMIEAAREGLRKELGAVSYVAKDREQESTDSPTDGQTQLHGV